SLGRATTGALLDFRPPDGDEIPLWRGRNGAGKNPLVQPIVLAHRGLKARRGAHVGARGLPRGRGDDALIVHGDDLAIVRPDGVNRPDFGYAVRPGELPVGAAVHYLALDAAPLEAAAGDGNKAAL